jgi:hypothetical protein
MRLQVRANLAGAGFVVPLRGHLLLKTERRLRLRFRGRCADSDVVIQDVLVQGVLIRGVAATAGAPDRRQDVTR